MESCGQISNQMTNTDHDLARLAARVGRHLLGGGRSVVTAESCTGGWIAKALTDIAGSSQWFIEGFVTYEGNWTIPHIRGTAYVNAEATLILQEDDPFRMGIRG